MKSKDGLQRLGEVGALGLPRVAAGARARGAREREVVATIAVSAIDSHQDPGGQRRCQIKLDRAVSEDSVRIAEGLDLIRQRDWIFIILRRVRAKGLGSRSAARSFIVSSHFRGGIFDGDRLRRVELNRVDEETTQEAA